MNTFPSLTDKAIGVLRSHIETYAAGSKEKTICFEIAIAARLLEDAAKTAAELGRPEISGDLIGEGAHILRLSQDAGLDCDRLLFLH